MGWMASVFSAPSLWLPWVWGSWGNQWCQLQIESGRIPVVEPGRALRHRRPRLSSRGPGAADSVDQRRGVVRHQKSSNTVAGLQWRIRMWSTSFAAAPYSSMKSPAMSCWSSLQFLSPPQKVMGSFFCRRQYVGRYICICLCLCICIYVYD